MNTASKLKDITAVLIMVLAVLKALLLALTLFHVPVLGAASYEALASSSMIKGPAFGAWLNLIPITIFFLLYCAALTVFAVATYLIAAHRKAMERNQKNEEE